MVKEVKTTIIERGNKYKTHTSADPLFLSGQNSRSVYDADAVQHCIWHLSTYKPERRGSNIKKKDRHLKQSDISPLGLVILQ